MVNDPLFEPMHIRQAADAVVGAAESVAIRRDAADDDPDARRAALAAALNNLAVQQGAAGRPAEAVASAEEAVAILRELAEAGRGPLRGGAATALEDLPRQHGPSQYGGDAQASTGGITRSLTAASDRALVLRIARIVGLSTRWPGFVVATASAALAASWPLVLELVLFFAAREYALVTVDAVAWVVALAVVNIASSGSRVHSATAAGWL